MSDAIFGRNYKLKVRIRQNAKGTYNWEATVQEDNLKLLEEQIQALKGMVESKIKEWEQNSTKQKV